MLGHVLTVPTVSPTLATMIGLGVGIDYALFIVTRHIRGLQDGLPMNESISRSAGAQYGQELPPDAMEQVIRSHGRVPRQRTTLYGDVPAERRAASFAAEPLAEPWNPPVRDAGLKAPSRLVRPGFVRA